MAQMLRLSPPIRAPATANRRHNPSPARSELTHSNTFVSTRSSEVDRSWISLQRKLKSRARFTCLFNNNNNNKQEQARKALENALGGKKPDFEKWDKEIKRREEAGGGGNSGGGGWFRWFGGSDDEHFWQEAQQASLAILGIIALYLIVAKGDVLLAFVFNPLLFALRGARNGLSFVTSRVTKVVRPALGDRFDSAPKYEAPPHVSAKESALRKWGSD